MDTQVRFSSRLAQVVRPLSLMAAALAIAGAAPTTAHAIAYAEADLFASITVESIENLTNPGDLSGLSVSFPEYMNYPEASDCGAPRFLCGTLGPSSVVGENSVTENAVTATGRAELTVLASPSLVGGYIDPWFIEVEFQNESDDLFQVTYSFSVDVTASASLTADFMGEILSEAYIQSGNSGPPCWGETVSTTSSGTLLGNVSARAYAPGVTYVPGPADPTRDAKDGFSGYRRETMQLWPNPGGAFASPCKRGIDLRLDVFADLQPNTAIVVPAPGAAAALPAFALLLVAAGRRRPTT